jgi:hypothetical protein
VTYVTAAGVPTTLAFGQAGWTDFGAGPVTSDLNGLAVPTNDYASYGFSPALPIDTGTALVDFASDSSFDTSAPGQFTSNILVRDAASSTLTFFAFTFNSDYGDPTLLWQVNAAIGSYAAFSWHSLAEFDTQLALDPAWDNGIIDAVATYNTGPLTAYLTNFLVDGTQYIFTPSPVSTAPTTITLADYGSTGLTVTTSGFLPNEAGIDVGIGSGGSGGSVGTVTADALGVATFTYIEPSPVAGGYRMTFTGSVPNPQIFDFAVTGALAVTGVDTTVPVIAGSVLLLGGAALAIVASKRRRTA